MPVTDAPDRERIRTSLDETLIVEAAAGTGKTTELIHRIVNVLAQGRAEVDRIVAVTFTEKAAGELKLRLREGLEHARHDLRQQGLSDPGRIPNPESRIAEQRRNLEQALEHLEEAHISTIHGFCADLLRERPLEARVDPRFEVLLEPEAKRLYGQAFDLWLQRALDDPPEGLRRSLRRTSRVQAFGSDEGTGGGPTARLQKAGWALVEWRDFPTAWRRARFDREAEIDRLVPKLHEFADLTRRPAKISDNLYRSTQPARRVSDHIRLLEQARAGRDGDGIEAMVVHLASDGDFLNLKKGWGAQYGKSATRAEILASHTALIPHLRRFVRAADADLAACLQHELITTVHAYEDLKVQAGKLDFVDLLLRARDVMRDEAAVRADFQERFTHIFVDEFQDIDPLQAEILLLLASDDPAVRNWQRVTPKPGKFFSVGDPKQSIYRFRRADVGVYQDVGAQLEKAGARRVRLTTSFRASPSIQNVVNAAFAPLMTGDRDALRAEYIPLSPERADPVDQPAVVALAVPRPYGRNRKVALIAVERSLPDAVGAFVESLIDESGWTVTEREPNRFRGSGLGTRDSERRVPVSARHICLLFRRFEKFGSDMTRPYVEALEARGIPHLLVGGKTFHNREEVETMRAALAAVEWPDDELSVFATLRGSLFAVGDELLLEYHHRFGRLHPFRLPEELRAMTTTTLAPSAQRLAPAVQALELLQSLHRRRNRVPVTETIGRLLDATRAHAAFVMRPSGEQALANVLHIAELARQYEAGGGISFRGFVEQLREEAEGSQAAEAPILEEGTDGVRIMTVHKAKGLEFPVVILVDMTASLARQSASRYIDPERRLCAQRLAGWSPPDLLEHEEVEVRREQAEGVRIAYVAATRARDLLVVPAVGDLPLENRWVAPLNAAIYPPLGRRRSSETGPTCPSFGTDSVLERPDGDPAGAENVCPGLHRFPHALTPNHQPPTPSYSVVWWDPKTLKLGAQVRFGLRQEELIGKDAPPEIIQADLRAYEDWKTRRDHAVEHGSSPSLVVRTVTECAAAAVRGEAGGQPPEDLGTDAVTLIDLPRDVVRPSGPRYGALVHAILATVSLDADRDRVAEVATLQGRILGATDEEVASASEVVSLALGHSLMARAREAAAKGACRRETPVTATAPDGVLIEGVVDLAFREGDAWTVVDFKTDRELADALDVYRRQVGLYADMVTQATGQPATAVLMKL